MKNKMCSYSGIVSIRQAKESYGYEFGATREIPSGIKRIRAKCPTCKRKLLTSIKLCHDGCCVIHSIPRHKRRHWWKKKKKVTKY